MRVRLPSYPEIWLELQIFIFSPTALITGTSMGAYEVFKGRRASMTTLLSALNGGVVAAMFFSQRHISLG